MKLRTVFFGSFNLTEEIKVNMLAKVNSLGKCSDTSENVYVKFGTTVGFACHIQNVMQEH